MRSQRAPLQGTCAGIDDSGCSRFGEPGLGHALSGVGSSTRCPRPARSRKGRRAARSLSGRRRRAGAAARVRARSCEERRPRERVHVSCLLQRSIDDVVAPRSTSPTREGWPGVQARASAPGDATSTMPARWRSRATWSEDGAGARESVAGFVGVGTIEGASGRRRRGLFTKATPGATSAEPDPDNAPSARRVRMARRRGRQRRGVHIGVQGRQRPGCRADQPLKRGSRREARNTSRSRASARRQREPSGSWVPEKNVSMAFIGCTHLWLKASVPSQDWACVRRSSPRRIHSGR